MKVLQKMLGVLTFWVTIFCLSVSIVTFGGWMAGSALMIGVALLISTFYRRTRRLSLATTIAAFFFLAYFVGVSAVNYAVKERIGFGFENAKSVGLGEVLFCGVAYALVFTSCRLNRF